MTVKNNKCVYLHRLDNLIVYVGRGDIRRVKSKKSRSEDHLKVWDKIKFEVFKDKLTEVESIELEQNLIGMN